MSLTIEQTDAAIREAFYGMEAGAEYILSDFWFTEVNRIRREYGHQSLKSNLDYKLSRNADNLFANNAFVFDFHGKDNLSLALAFPLSFVFTLALQHNGLEKLNKDTCDGKVIEIDGLKYKLTAVWSIQQKSRP